MRYDLVLSLFCAGGHRVVLDLSSGGDALFQAIFVTTTLLRAVLALEVATLTLLPKEHSEHGRIWQNELNCRKRRKDSRRRVRVETRQSPALLNTFLLVLVCNPVRQS